MMSRIYSHNLARPERRFARHLVGDFTFALQSSETRQKIVLERNITQILDHHQKRCTKKPEAGISTNVCQIPTQGSRNATSETSAGPAEANGVVSSSIHSSEEPSAAHSSLPVMPSSAQTSLQDGRNPTERKTRRSLRGFSDKVYEEPDAELTLDLSNIRKKLNFKNNAHDDGERPSKRQKRETIKCQCYLTVWDNRDGYNIAPLVSKSEYCYVSPREIEPNGFFVDVELEKPFSIRASELKVSVLVRNEEIFALIDNYFLELKIIPCRSDSRWPPIPLLGKSDGDHFAPDIKRNGAEVLQGAVVARYTHLPQAPEADTALSVFFLHEGRTYRTKYGLQVDSIWQKSSSRSSTTRRRPDGLDLDLFRTPEQKASNADQETNALESERSNSTLAKLSTNGISGSAVSGFHNGLKSRTDGADATVVEHPEVCYDFCSTVEQKFRYATVKGYRCPLCAIWKTSKLDRLVFHLSTMHAKYSFQLQRPQRDPVSKELTHIQIKVNHPPTVKKGDEHVIAWEAPPKPFNLPAYANGDRDWVGSTETKKQSPEGSRGTLQSAHQPLPLPKPATAIPDFRTPRRKKFKAVKLLSKYGEQELVHTSISHRPVSPSEDGRSETEDEIDNEWQVELHMERLDFEGRRGGWTDCERDLYKRWDRHRMEEQLEHSRYLPNSLVRFARKHRAWLKHGNEELLEVFLDFLDRLKQHATIDDDTICEVNALIFRASPPPESSRQAGHNGTLRSQTPTRRSSRHLKADTSKSDTPQSQNPPTPGVQHHERLQPSIDRTLRCGHCSTPVPRARKSAVYCVDPECETPGITYHINCAEEAVGWKPRRKGKGKRKTNGPETGAELVTGLGVQDRSSLELSTWCCPPCTRRRKDLQKENELAASAAEAGGTRNDTV
ncbi:hypothetical protein H2204_000678 [Knufia peltigerae]|uniref:Polycomb protein VEFS-Box domain-containing protein n=1 Tax=Knufia peltigerae TaxID=1002370 RepID=A0AA38YDY3_9EURO|nr:hypothetical protein H2204_000678 [Knufia peltigerae]